MMTLPWLSYVIWGSIAGGFACLGLRNKPCLAKSVAVLVSLFMLALCAPLVSGYSSVNANMQFVEYAQWIPSLNVHYHLGIDGISLPLIVLTVLTTPIILLVSWHSIDKKIAEYSAVFLVLQGLIVGVFSALDSILFYFFWEAMLIPMYLCIGIWGGKNRSYAAVKFFLYTFLGSVLMLAALIYLAGQANSFGILDFYGLPLSLFSQKLLFLGFLMAFAVKIPMWPVHTWLPDAHTEAPTGGSVILAAILLKMGAYGLLRFSLPITPDASFFFAPLMIGLSLIAVVGIGLVALVQEDMKRLIAYSSVAHMGFVTLGIFAAYAIGDNAVRLMAMEGAYIQMISHAFVSTAMFAGFGCLYDRMKTRDIASFGGVASVMPIFTAFYLFFAMANAGLPGTSGFVGEFMVILASFQINPWVAIAAALSLIVGASYTLIMFKRVFYGPVHHRPVEALQDINTLDRVVMLVLALAVLVLGFMPNTLIQMSENSINTVIQLGLNLS